MSDAYMSGGHVSTRSVSCAIALCGALLAPATAPAASPWSPFRASSFSLRAGVRCTFPLSGTVLEDQERIRTTVTDPDGTVRQQQGGGRLVVRYTNGDSGASVVRNLIGNALIDYGTGGALSITLKGGHFSAGLAATDPGGPAFLVFTGHGHRLDVAADGTRTVTVGHGAVENLCDTLARS